MEKTLIVPLPMRRAKRWFPVAVAKNGDKWDKKPIVEWSKPENWTTFDECKADAKGFVLGDGFFGIDLDGCLDELACVTEERRELVNDVFDWCPSFTEISWSGKGLHVYGYGKMPKACKDATPGLEMYSNGRFFLFTGRMFDAEDTTDLVDIQDGIEKLYAKYGRKEANAKPSKNETASEGHRSNTIFAKATVLYKLGFSEPVIVAAMTEWNKENCKPPLSDDVVRKQCADRYPEQHFDLPETDEESVEVLTLERTVDIAVTNLVGFCENKKSVSFGFPAIDQVLGRLPGGSMTIIGGETGSGKSHMVGSIARNSAKVGNKPGIISIEDPIDEWGVREMAHLTGVTTEAVLVSRTMSDDARADLYAQIFRAVDMARDVDVLIAYAISANMETVVQAAKHLIVDKERNLILVDYAQAVRVNSNSARIDKAYADVAKRLKGLCAKHKVPLVLTSQLSRSKDEPTKHSLKETGDLENEAEIVMLLWEEKNTTEPRILWKIAKAKWAKERPSGYVQFGVGGTIVDLVIADIQKRNHNYDLD